MRTRILNDTSSAAPWFEYYQVGNSRPIKQAIGELPYVIGRDESADFCVESSRVSRKHVMIDRRDGGFILRDLESTNGTYVNGKRITEVTLVDGDVIVIADFELTFFSGMQPLRATATQVMTQPVSEQLTNANDLIIQVRRLHERITHRAIKSCFQPIVRLDGGELFGYEVVRQLRDLPGESQLAESLIAGTECRLTERINHQHRLCAAEDAMQLGASTHLFFGLQVAEVSAEFGRESLDRLVDIVARKHQLVAEIPETAVCDIPYFRQFVANLSERGIEIAYGGFCMGPAQIAEWRTMAPNYLKLAPAVVRGVRRASGGWRMIQSLLEATRDLGCEVIAVGIDDESDAQCLRELGCAFAQGDHFGPPEPLASHLQRKPALAASGRST